MLEEICADQLMLLFQILIAIPIVNLMIQIIQIYALVWYNL